MMHSITPQYFKISSLLYLNNLNNSKQRSGIEDKIWGGLQRYWQSSFSSLVSNEERNARYLGCRLVGGAFGWSLVKTVKESRLVAVTIAVVHLSLGGGDDLFHLSENLIRRLCSIQLVNQVQLLKVPYDGHCCLFIGDKSFAQALFIVISSATACCSSAQASSCTDLLSAVEEKHPTQVHLVAHSLRFSLVNIVPNLFEDDRS